MTDILAPSKQNRSHVVEEVHFSRKGEHLSVVTCHCGERLEIANESDYDRGAAHAKIADDFALHRLGHPRRHGHGHGTHPGPGKTGSRLPTGRMNAVPERAGDSTLPPQLAVER